MKNYLKSWYAEIKKSWTMLGIGFFAILGVAESQFELLRPVIGDKYYGLAYFITLSVLALLRLRGISQDMKIKAK